MSTATLSAADQVRNAFDFSVDKFPLGGPDGLTTPWYGLFRSDNSKVVGEGSVTDRYVPHQTDDVIALVEACENVFGESHQTKTHFRNGHYVSIAPSDDYRRSVAGSSEGLWPRLLIRGGYDRKAFNVTLGIYRDSCVNLMMMTSVSETYQSIRHLNGLRDAMDELIGQFQTLENSWQNLGSLIDNLNATDVNMVDFLNSVYPVPEQEEGRAVTIHRNRTEKIFKRLQRDRMRTGRPAMGSDWVVTAWEAYNAVQGFHQHDAPRRAGFTGEFDRVLQAAKATPVKKAESLAIALAS